MSEKVRVPEIRFTDFSDEWEEQELIDIVDVCSGKDYKHLSSGKIPVYGTGGYMLSVNDSLSNIDAIGIGRKGTIDKPYILKAPFWTVDTLFYSLPKENKDLNFIYGLFQIIDWAKKDESTGLPSLSRVAINSTKSFIPKQLEQTKIGTFFQQIDKLITFQSSKCVKLKNIKKSMLEKMFPKEGSNVPEIRFAGFTEPWGDKKLGELISFIVDNRGKNPKYYCNDGIPVIDNYMIKNNCYPNLKEANRFIDESLFNTFIRDYNEVDDVLITLVGNGIGNITLFPRTKSVIIQNTLGLRFSNDKKFMFFCLLSNNSKIVFLDRGMAQPSIRQDELLDVDIKVPLNHKEQFQIGNYFTNLDSLITLQNTKLEKLKNIKKSCLEKMFV